MSSADIKDILVQAYPGTKASDWKRTSKKEVDGVSVRTFKNGDLEVTTHDEQIVGAPVAKPQLVGETPEFSRQMDDLVKSAQVEPTENPPKPSAKTKEPPKKALMKKGTTWRAVRDIKVEVLVRNPKWEVAAARARNERSRGSKTPFDDYVKGIPERVSTPLIDIPAGTEMKIIDKQTQDWGAGYGGDRSDSNGTMIPFEFPKGQSVIHRLAGSPINGNIGQGWFDMSVTDNHGVLTTYLPYKQIEAHVEPAEELKEQFIYLIRDSATGLFYKTTGEGYLTYHTNPEWQKWLQERDQFTGEANRNLSGPAWTAEWARHRARQEEFEKGHPEPYHGEYKPVHGVEPFEMVDKASKAKQHTDMGKVKTTILNFTGYFDGMKQDPDLPWFFESAQSKSEARPHPFLKTFEAVKMEKFTKKVVEVIDLQGWYDRTWRLRGLTQTFGPTVRDLYNKADKAGELDRWQYIVSFRVGKADERIRPEHVAEAKEIMANLGLKKSIKTSADAYSFSVLVDSISSAIAVKMTSNDLMSSIIDLSTMMERVQETELPDHRY